VNLPSSGFRGYVRAFKGFHGFLLARKATESEVLFEARLVDPLDEFSASRHVAHS
jgi:integrase/recombinase XerD